MSAAVLLVPGLWMPAQVMQPLARRLRKRGFQTLLFGYASIRATLSVNAQRLAHYVESVAAPRLHLVGHSLGGLVVLNALELLAPGRVERVILLGSPFRDSFAGRALARMPLVHSLLGLSMAQWLAGDRRAPRGVHDIGVIAGNRRMGVGRMVVRNMPQPNDGEIGRAHV